MNAIGKNVVLRAIEVEDLALLGKWSNDPEIQKWLGGWHSPSSKAVMMDWYERITRDNDNLRFAIEHKKLGFIGTANLVNINYKDRTAFHGMLLGDEDVRRKGIGMDVVLTIMKYAFEELNLFRLDTTIIEYNEPSIKLYTKCGWRKEGVRKAWYFRSNKRWDKICYGITREDYFEMINPK